MEAVEPIPVKLVSTAVSFSLETPKLKDRTSTYRTIQTATTPDSICGHAPNRMETVITVLGVVGTNSLIVIGDSQGALNGFVNGGVGNGMVLQPGQSVRIHNTDQMYIMAFGTGTAPLVSIMQTFERAGA